MVFCGGRHSTVNSGSREKLVRFRLGSLRQAQEIMEEMGIDVTSQSEVGSRFLEKTKMKVFLVENFCRDLEVRV